MDPLARIGSEAPAFRLTDLDGRAYEPRQARGTILVLNFWSAECPHSERLDRALAALLPAWGEEVVLWSVAPNVNESPTMLRRAADERGVSVVLPDPSQLGADRYGAVATPHLFLIDRSGILRYQGAPDDASFRQRKPSRSYLQPAIEAMLAGRQPDPAETLAFGCAITRAVPIS